MDEVRVERLIQKYKDNGELASEDPALVMLKTWPASNQYQYISDRLPGLEQLVCIKDKIICTSLQWSSCTLKVHKQKHHTLENLVTHGSKTFWSSCDCL